MQEGGRRWRLCGIVWVVGAGVGGGHQKGWKRCSRMRSGRRVCLRCREVVEHHHPVVHKVRADKDKRKNKDKRKVKDKRKDKDNDNNTVPPKAPSSKCPLPAPPPTKVRGPPTHTPPPPACASSAV